MSKFDDFLDLAIKDGKDLIVGEGEDFVKKFRTGVKNFITDSNQDFNRWTSQLADKKLTKVEFDVLVGTLKGEAALDALTKAGIAAAKAQQLRDALIKLVVDSAIKIFI